MNTRNPLAAALVLAVAIPALAAGPAQRSPGTRSAARFLHRQRRCEDQGQARRRPDRGRGGGGQQPQRPGVALVLRHNGDLSCAREGPDRGPQRLVQVERRTSTRPASTRSGSGPSTGASGQVCVVRVKL